MAQRFRCLKDLTYHLAAGRMAARGGHQKQGSAPYEASCFMGPTLTLYDPVLNDPTLSTTATPLRSQILHRIEVVLSTTPNTRSCALVGCFLRSFSSNHKVTKRVHSAVYDLFFWNLQAQQYGNDDQFIPSGLRFFLHRFCALKRLETTVCRAKNGK